MTYFTPTPVVADALRIANLQTGAGNRQAAALTLYRHGLTWADLLSYQQARYPMQHPQAKRLLPPVLRGFGDALPVPAQSPAVASPADPTIEQQVAAIHIDWSTGNLWVGPNKYSLLTTLLGGLVIKGMLFGGSKIAALGKHLVGGKQVPNSVQAPSATA